MFLVKKTQFFTNCKWKKFFGALPVDPEPGILISGSGEAWDQANAQGDPDASHSPEKNIYKNKYGLLETEKWFSVWNVYGLLKTEKWSTIWLITCVWINIFPLFGPTYELIPMYD